ncbi:hypothetical protein F4777DRAFT_592556 [Nemania sp. FL0916]|nr:hypothetical protein F4777DRAFT_592556 [Nemania sp. FL0916]
MLGVYQAVDPSVYSDVYPESPDPRIREIADLMVEWFQLFINLGYVNAENVVFPPHEHLRIDTAQAAELGLTKDVVDLYQMLPYNIGHMRRSGQTNWNFGTDRGEFVLGGGFLSDMRGSKAGWWRTAVDPFYRIDELDPSRRPEFRPSDADTRGWNHENDHIWLIEQLGGSSDPAFQGNNRIRDSKLPNKNDLDQYPSRPAVEFLRDMISRFRSLVWVPGGLYGEGEDYAHDKEYSKMRQLYTDCGWPDKFNPIVFESQRRGGDKLHIYHAGVADPSEQERLYSGLSQLTDAMVAARERVQMQIHIIDARYRLENKKYDNRWEEERLRSRILQSEDYLFQPKWDENNAGLRTELDFRKTNLEALRIRGGCYAGPGWAGVSNEEIHKLYERAARDNRIATLETLLRDEDLSSRITRKFREAKAAAAATPGETWKRKAVEDSKWENDDWKDRWSILGSGTNLVDLKIGIDEDMSIEELERRIVYELEKNEDRSWRGQRIWRNNEGKVAEIIEVPDDTPR